jgi:membrane protein implicated in regulation of membrane protease activity
VTEDHRIPFTLLLMGVLGLVATGAGVLAAPAWAWLGLVAAGLAHSLLWRAAGVRSVSARERRKHERRLRNAERRERRLIRIASRTEQRVKEVLARGVDVSWAEKTAAAVRELQHVAEQHHAALQANKMLTDKAMEQLGGIFSQARLQDEDR